MLTDSFGNARGIVADKIPGPDWKPIKKGQSDWWSPRRGTKAGKAIDEEMNQVKHPDVHDFIRSKYTTSYVLVDSAIAPLIRKRN